jgi:hypothetical protein
MDRASQRVWHDLLLRVPAVSKAIVRSRCLSPELTTAVDRGQRGGASIEGLLVAGSRRSDRHHVAAS